MRPYSLGKFAKLTVFTGYRRTQRHARPWAHGRQGHYARMCRRQVSVWRQGFKSLQGYPTRIWHFNIWIEYLYGLVMVFGFRFGLNWCRVRGTTKYFIRVAGNWQRMKERKKENNNRKYKYN